MIHEMGGQVVYQAAIESSQPDLKPDMMRMRTSGAKVIMPWSVNAGFLTRLLNTRANLGWDVPVIGQTTLGSGQTCKVVVMFTPDGAGARSANLVVTRADGVTHTVPLAGTGGLPGLSADPGVVNFFNQPVGTTSPDAPRSSMSCVPTYSTKPAVTPPRTIRDTPPKRKNLKETEAATNTIATNRSGRAKSTSYCRR